LIVVVVVTGAEVGVVPGVVVVRLKEVPFLRLVMTVLASGPRKELKSPLSLSATLDCPWLAASESIWDASVFRVEVVWVCAWANPGTRMKRNINKPEKILTFIVILLIR
jgi:hypothetical protein